MSKAKPKRTERPDPPRIDPYVSMLLERIVDGKNALSFPKGRKVFSQGDPADAIYFIQSGKVKITVVSSAGKEAVLAMLGPHDFFGEGSLVGQSLRVSHRGDTGTLNSVPRGEAGNAPSST